MFNDYSWSFHEMRRVIVKARAKAQAELPGTRPGGAHCRLTLELICVRRGQY
jgi:hypothetical protein